MRKKIVLAAAAALGLALSTGATVAQADTSQASSLDNAPSVNVSVLSANGEAGVQAECYYPIYSPDRGAMVCFQPYGEHLYICDAKADGHHPVARYYRSDKSGRKVKHSTYPNPQCLDHNLSIPESGWINYQACNYEKKTALSCSAYRGRVSAG
ncbi:hypothetical protein [Amycolatopsis aidingensis]|uniref:hypothetical protein n=1 Tax=Amycolatopsis aidingensis TaxID=2842453 RepID=UPI001C0AE69A|nr:hypothetical protein [Amycolatopsis aidingensis]